jgi:hypothetical protein
VTSADRFGILLAFLTAALAGMGWLIRLSLRALVKWTQTEDRLAQVVDDLDKLVAWKTAEHAEIKERLTYLERTELEMWRKAGRDG